MKLLESIKYYNGQFANLDLHQNRMNFSCKELFGTENNFDLFSALSRINTVKLAKNQIYKCRIVYAIEIESIEFIAYDKPKIKSLKLVNSDSISYNYKFENRNDLSDLFAQRDNCDDILIVKDGLITDTYFCNIIFFNGKQWITPEKPLLKGVQRQHLLNAEKIETANIRVSDLKHFSQARLINALLNFENSIEINPNDII